MCLLMPGLFDRTVMVLVLGRMHCSFAVVHDHQQRQPHQPVLSHAGRHPAPGAQLNLSALAAWQDGATGSPGAVIRAAASLRGTGRR